MTRDIFDSPTFAALYSATMGQRRIANVRRCEAASAASALEECAADGYPLIIYGATINTRGFWQEKLLSHCGANAQLRVRTGTYDAPFEYTSSRRHRTMSMRKYLATLDVERATSPGYAANQPLAPDSLRRLGIELPALAAQLPLEPPALWIGGPGATTPLHKDSNDNFAFHLFGSKRWLLFPVRDAPHLSLRPTIDKPGFADFAASRIDLRPDVLSSIGHLPRAKAVCTTVNGGDMLYIPAGWSHLVETLEATAMVNTWVDARRMPPAVLCNLKLAPYDIQVLSDTSSIRNTLALRYEVLVCEQGDNRYAVHSTRLHQDCIDFATHSVVAAAMSDGELVGSLRLVPGRFGPIIGDEFYQWDVLAQAMTMEAGEVRRRSAIVDRAVVRASFRRKGTMRALMKALFNEARRRECDFVLAAVSAENTGARRMLERLGFTTYGVPAGNVWTGLHFVLDLR